VEKPAKKTRKVAKLKIVDEDLARKRLGVALPEVIGATPKVLFLSGHIAPVRAELLPREEEKAGDDVADGDGDDGGAKEVRRIVNNKL
jgi:hypothetical protein